MKYQEELVRNEKPSLYNEAGERFGIIAFHRLFVAWTGSITAALFLSQLVYWSRHTQNKSGWIYKTMNDWEEETGLKRAQQVNARRLLTEVELIEEKLHGIPARMYFRLGPQFFNKPQMAAYRYRLPVAGKLAGRSQADSEAAHVPTNAHKTTHKTTNNPPNPPEGGKGSFNLGEGKIHQALKEFRQLIRVRTGKQYTDHILQGRWRTVAESFVQEQLQGNQVHFLEVLEWYMQNIDGDYIPECISIPKFCERFRQIEKARSRNHQNGTDKAPPVTTTVYKGKGKIEDTW